MTRPLKENKFLLRFQNMNDKEDKFVDTSVFQSERLGVGKVVETSLTANQPKTEMIKNRFDWNNLGLNNPGLAKNDYLETGKN